MPSGDTLCVFGPLHNQPPASNYATLDVIAAADGVRPVLDFDGSTDEAAIFSGVLPRNYSGGGLTVKLFMAMGSGNAAVKVVGLAVSIERVAAGDALGGAGSAFAAANTAEITVDNDQDDLFTGEVTFSDGADMDSLAAGEAFRLKVARQNSGLSGTNATGDMQLLAVEIRET